MKQHGASAAPSDDRGTSWGSFAISAGAVWQGAVVAALILVVAAGLFLTFWLIAYPLALLMAAIVLSNALAPLVRLFERCAPSAGAIALTYLSLVLFVGALGWVVIPGLLEQVLEVTAVAPALLARGRDWLDGVAPGLSSGAIRALRPLASQIGAELLEAPLALAGFAIGLAVVLLMSVYWSIGSDDLRQYVFSLVPRHLRDKAAEVATEVVDTIGGYLRARAIVGVLIGVVTFAGLSLIGVEYPLALAVLAAAGELIPYLGPTLAAVPAIAFSLSISPWQAATVFALYVAVQQVKAFFLMPILVRQQANIPPLLVILALIAGTSVGGVIGAIVAPPLFGALRVILVRVVTPPLRRWADTSRLGAGDEATREPTAEPRDPLRDRPAVPARARDQRD